MASIDVALLLEPLSDDAPCGDDLEYDPAFGEMERAAQSKPEQQVGDSIIPAEDPNWKDLKSKALAILERSKDVRAAVHLTRALAHTDGFPGLADGLALIRGLHDEHWEGYQPQLDPDDDHDPMMRMNILTTLCDNDAVLRSVKEAPMVSSKMVGQFNLHDLMVATGELPVPSSGESPDPALIDAAFMEVEIEELEGTAAAVATSIEHVEAIEARVTDLVGAGNAPSLNPLVEVFKHVQAALNERLSRRGVVTASSGGGEDAGAVASGSGGGGGGAQPIRGEIGTRDDALRMMEKISDWFVRNEPSSPIPLLMQRAKRLVSKGFMEILRDMAPSGVTEAENITGVEAAGDSGWGSSTETPSEESGEGW